MTYLSNLAIRNFRGIGGDWQYLTGLSSMNFFIGQNNAGKSTVLRLVASYLPSAATSRGSAVANEDFSMLNDYAEPAIMLGFTPEAMRNALNKPRQAMSHFHGSNPIDVVIDNFTTPERLMWFGRRLKEKEFKLVSESKQDPHTSALWNAISVISQEIYQTHSSIPTQCLERARELLMQYAPTNVPEAEFIPAHRRINNGEISLKDNSGVGLIRRLFELQSPTLERSLSDKPLFSRINAFLATVTGEPDARIRIPHDLSTVLVEYRGATRPLENLGTGIHQVIMIAAFCTAAEKKIVCIEEPELHLHPLLQRKLVDYLRTETNNQYFIATHSAAFIDTPGASIYHVRLDGHHTTVHSAKVDADRYRICADLGQRASDIIQTNAVIWVEGPSDRIYIKHWLRAVDDRLIEGKHYSIMFYGGRLLSHLTADDEEIDDFISLRDLNRNLAVVIDSDRRTRDATINSTKARIVREIGDHGGVVWVTAGREIENYVANVKLQEAVKALNNNYVAAANRGGAFDCALEYESSVERKLRKDRLRMPDKVKVAHRIAEEEADMELLDLRTRIGELVAMILQANDLGPVN